MEHPEEEHPETPAEEQDQRQEAQKKNQKSKKSPKSKFSKKSLAKRALCLLVLLVLALFTWKEWTEQFARWVPDYPQMALHPVTTVAILTQEEQAELLAQTGLTAIGLERLEQAGRLGELETFQQAFFTPGVEVHSQDLGEIQQILQNDSFPMLCQKNSPISWEESLLDSQGLRGTYLPLVPLEVGDILLTSNSHGFGWRQGHAGLVVDAHQGITLESVVLGEPSITQWAHKWQGFPAAVILRPKDPGLGQEAVVLAMEHLAEVPYDLLVGLTSPKAQSQEEISGTHCSHLIWQAYAWAGVDLDSNGGTIVSPQDLAHSPQLEVVQVWGMDPELLW